MARHEVSEAATVKIFNTVRRLGKATRVQINRECPEYSTEYIRHILGNLVDDRKIVKDDKRNWPPVYRVVE